MPESQICGHYVGSLQGQAEVALDAIPMQSLFFGALLRFFWVVPESAALIVDFLHL